MATREVKPDRLSALSDGVFAVIIGIPVLELKPPQSPSLKALFSLCPTAVSYAVSYLFITIVRVNHHHLLRCGPRDAAVDLGKFFPPINCVDCKHRASCDPRDGPRGRPRSGERDLYHAVPRENDAAHAIDCHTRYILHRSHRCAEASGRGNGADMPLPHCLSSTGRAGSEDVRKRDSPMRARALARSKTSCRHHDLQTRRTFLSILINQRG
jgi:Endosomal/lysosomal potassium channel TMEM175